MLHPYTAGTLITANARLTRQLRREYDAARREEGQRVWESPDILPRDAWLARVWQERVYDDPANSPLLLSPMQEEVLWERAIAASDTADVLLDLPATAAAAARAWGLLHDWETRHNPAEFAVLPDPAAFSDWMQTVERQLRDQHWITASQLPRALTERIVGGSLKFTGPIAHTGFDELTPADQRLFEMCGVAEWPIAAAFPHPAQHRTAFDSAADELTHAAGWARRRLEAEPGARMGIVVRELAAQATTVERIFDDVLEPGLGFTRSHTGSAFHISAGVPSADTPLIAAALLALGLKSGLTAPEAGMLFRSPFLRLDRLEGARLGAELRRQGVEKVSIQVDMVRRAFPDFAAAADQARPRQHPGEWSTWFSKLLTLAGWPGPRPLSPIEYQTLEHWKKLLSGLASLDLVMPRIGYEKALSILRRIARNRRFAPSDEDAPIQVMDVLEAAGSRFNALWIAGLHAGVWPQAPRPNSFLPLALQRAAGMPHSSPERELAYARHVTTRLLAAAPEVICSFARFSGEEPMRISPLIEELPDAADTFTAPKTSLRTIFAAGAVLEEQPPDQAPPLPEGTTQRGGMNLIKNQAACPFRAFAEHRLGARERDAADLGLSPAERGTVAHEALDILWRELKSQDRLLARSTEEIAELVKCSVSAALNRPLSRRYKSKSLDRARELEEVRWERLLAEWLEIERSRPKFEVVEREERRQADVGGLKLDIRVDRVDRLADGTLAVLDYKTSDKLTPKAWDGERPDEPQLPLYAVERRSDISAVYFAKLVPGRSKPLGREGADLQSRLPEWKITIENLGSSFRRGDAAVNPKDPPETCEFCKLHALCRIGELGTTREAEDAQDE